MNFALIFKLIGSILKIESAFMIVPLMVSIIYKGADTEAFFSSILFIAFLGHVLTMIEPSNKKFRTKDAFAAVSLTWIFFSLLGALPYYLSGSITSYVDCIFESVSGFTTTGATILSNVEALPRGIAFWRCFTHWIGGMGVLVFMLAVMQSANASSVNLLKAETTGPAVGRFVPKIRETARKMYIIYVVMTLILFALLVIAGLPVFDALTHTFSTSGTGGFSILNKSIGEYNNLAAEIIITVFMFLFGISFTLYYYLFTGNHKGFFRDEELRFYFLVVAASIIVITINVAPVYGSVATALREASFQVTTLVSTTGFSTTNYNIWPTSSRFILIILMLTGCCAGSTGGGIKLIRILILMKAVRVEMNKIIHPRSVKIITINGKKSDNDTVLRIALFFFIYLVFFATGVLIISFQGHDMITSITAVIATLSNVGPGFGLIGPIDNYAFFSNFTKIVLSFFMLIGRLEFFPILILLSPSIWREKDTL